MEDRSDGVLLTDGPSRLFLHRPEQRALNGFDHRVDLVGGPFRGSIKASAYLNPYERFCAELATLYETLTGAPELGGYENLNLSLKGDGLGHIQADVCAIADHVRDTKLTYQMTLDQTQLPEIIASIRRIFL
jgi:hypothetical protein